MNKRHISTVSLKDGRITSSCLEGNNGSTNNNKDKNIKLKLENRELWQKFASFGTEMIITKTGRFDKVYVYKKWINPMYLKQYIYIYIYIYIYLFIYIYLYIYIFIYI